MFPRNTRTKLQSIPNSLQNIKRRSNFYNIKKWDLIRLIQRSWSSPRNDTKKPKKKKKKKRKKWSEGGKEGWRRDDVFSVWRESNSCVAEHRRQSVDQICGAKRTKSRGYDSRADLFARGNYLLHGQWPPWRSPDPLTSICARWSA